MGAVAGAEPALPLAPGVAATLAQRNAAEVGADADHDQPFGALDASAVRLGIGQITDIHGLGFVDLSLSVRWATKAGRPRHLTLIR